MAANICTAVEEPEVDGLRAMEALSSACGRMVALGRDSERGRQQFHRVVSAIHGICDALTDCEAAGVPAADLRQIGSNARETHGQSPFIRRLQEWPRGYAGDFETIEWLWRGENRAPIGTLGYALEAYALTAAIAQQHRNKVHLQARCVLEAAHRKADCRVLSIGCGSSPDIRSVAPHVPASATFVFCDSDEQALEFSRRATEGADVQRHFVHGIVPRVLRRLEPLAPFDLILAGGLFDYLPDRWLARTAGDAWNRLLAPGGRLVFTNIATGNPFRVWLEYMADWRLIERSELDVVRLCRDAEIPVEPTLRRDETGLAILATVTRS
jgi:extracellular factor (EF) 3-hydroxypalmitic acid methyl ester biosynthesis protein